MAVVPFAIDAASAPAEVLNLKSTVWLAPSPVIAQTSETVCRALAATDVGNVPDSITTEPPSAIANPTKVLAVLLVISALALISNFHPVGIVTVYSKLVAST